jgi:hypothetical protein
MATKLPSDIELARARQIVQDMTAWHWVDLGFRDGPAPDLESYELREMIDAAAMMRVFGKQTNRDGSISHMVVPDDRLIAALYTITHWPAYAQENAETIISGHGKGLICVRIS